MSAIAAMEPLFATVSAVCEMMLRRLQADAIDADTKREIEAVATELQAEALALKLESERYADFFEFAPDAYLITDAGGSVREANQAALEMLGARRENVVGRALSDYIAAKARLQPALGEPFDVVCSARAITLKKDRAPGLCWLVRRAA